MLCRRGRFGYGNRTRDITVKEIIILSDIPNEGTILMSWGKLLDLLSFCFFHFIRLVH